jgi:hypothetical protein
MKNLITIMLLILCSAAKAQVSVNLPVVNTQLIGGEEYYPINVGDLTGKNVTAFQLSIYYNKSIIQITDANTSGLMTSGNQVYFFADTANGLINIAWASATPLAGSGDIVKIKIKYLTAGTSLLTCVNSVTTKNSLIFNNGTPSAAVNDGSVNITGQSYSISGKATYDNNASNQIQNVQVILTGAGNFQASSLTNALGNYSFNNLSPGTYAISFTKTGEFAAVNATDALMALRRFVFGIDLDAPQLLAADVNNDNSINSTDALMILRRFTGLISTFSKPDWILIPSVNSIVIQNQNVMQNITGITCGDVDRSWMP